VATGHASGFFVVDANGKSVFLGVLWKLLGEYAGATSVDTFASGATEARTDLAKLRGCSFDYLPMFKLWPAMNHKPIIRFRCFSGFSVRSLGRRLYRMPFWKTV
jgi:phage/plasmid-associated DNA primase